MAMAKQILPVTTSNTMLRPNLSFLFKRSPKLSYLLTNSFVSVKSSNPLRTSLAARSTDQENVRQLANFSPSLWGDRFLNFTVDELEIEKLEREIELVKPKVRDMITFSMDRPIDKIILIDTVSRIGISYHFDDDITEQLNLAFDNLKDVINDETDLYSVAVAFRVFRHHGFNISCDVFDRFKGNDGKFKKYLSSDIRGLWSLYEASFFGMTGEDTMDDAHDFTKPLLESFSSQSSCHLSQLIAQILLYPCLDCLTNIEARRYISFYERENNPNETIIKLANTESKLIQMQHRKELYILSSWWKDIIPKMPFTRDRIVEMFIWSLGTYPEPCDSEARILMAKLYMVTSFVDDVYEAFGTLQELQSFTDAIQRFDKNSVHHLPISMQSTYKATIDIVEELDKGLSKQGRSFSLFYLKEEFKKVVKAYLAEVKWSRSVETPSYDEYMEVAQITSMLYVTIMLSVMLMREDAWNEAFAWVVSRPRIISYINTLGRVIDDLAGYKDEQARGVLNGFMCYMKQHKLTEQEAVLHYQKKIQVLRKLINDEFMKTMPISRQVRMKVLHNAQLLHMTYAYGDSYSHPERKGHFKDFIKMLLLDPIH